MIRSERPAILSRVKARFALVASAVGTFVRLNPVIHLFSNVDDLLSDGKVIYGVTTPITATGNYWPMTVPEGKRYKVLVVDIYDTGAGTWTVAEIIINDVSELNAMPIASFTGTNDATYGLPIEVQLEEGDQLGVGCDSWAVQSNLGFRAYVIEEDA